MRRKTAVIKYSLVLTAFILVLLAFLPRTSNEDDNHFLKLADHFDVAKNANGYRNSESLREQLRPKLAGPLTKSKKKSSVLWDDVGAAHNADDVKLRDEGYKMFAFNTLVSSRISLRREIPDTRHAACRNLTYSIVDLPTASVIICFYREDTSTLLRTIHSVIDRSPPRALHQIILVNDATDIDIIPNITNHIESQNLSSIVTLLNAPERLGLIRARIYGAKHATGDVLVFLDSHVEANVQWLEPLLSRIKADRRSVVTPIIDIVNSDTWKYEPSPLVRGGFNWGLNFKWDPIPRSELQTHEDFAKPFKSPTMAGGLFAIDKEYFHHLGEYDPGMNVWGGENLELSFKVWMCGGTLEILPCSRVGHVFRKRRPYGSSRGGDSEEDTMIRNSLRVAKVWMDEYIKYYYEVNSNAKNVDHGDITDRIALRQRLQCKSFQWYMENVYPDLSPPGGGNQQEASQRNNNNLAQVKYEKWDQKSRNYLRQFSLGFQETKLCLQSEKMAAAEKKKSKLSLAYCMGKTKLQTWYLTDKNELVLSRLLCLDAAKNRARLMKCHELGGSQEWKIKERSDDGKAAIYNVAAGLCLISTTNEDDDKHWRQHINITLGVCSDDSYLWSLMNSKILISK